MHEIVSLQFGQQSNYVGQHFWNTQESYFTYGGEEESPVDHDVNFRQGRAPDGSDTYTPRAVIYDLKGAFGTLRKTNALYEVGEDQEWDRSLWGGKRTVHRSDPIPPSEYQQHLDAGTEPPPLTTSTVRFWSDYARLYYHPKSLIQLHEHSVHDRIAPFEKWDVGEELFNTLDKEHDLLDRDLRPFVEECDHMQGFQVVASVDGAWGGFATRYTERIRDEYGKKGIWVWGTEEGGTRSKDKHLLRLVNSTKTLYDLSTHASVYIPMASAIAQNPSYLSFDENSPWHTSALQAVALETMSLPCRLRSIDTSKALFNDLEVTLNNNGNQKVMRLQLNAADPSILEDHLQGNPPAARDDRTGVKPTTQPDPMDSENQLFDIDMLPATDSSARSLQPSKAKKEHIFGQVETLRGAWENAEDIERANAESRHRFHSGPVVQRYAAALLFPLLDSFPRIINMGGVGPQSAASPAMRGNALALRTSLSTTSSIADRIRAAEAAVRKLVSVDEREALSNGLRTLAEEYEEGWLSGSDETDEE